MADQSRAVKGVAFDLYFSLYKTDGTIIPNPGTYTAKIIKNGGTVADCANSVTEVDTTYGCLKLTLSATEMNADSVWVQIKDDTTGCVPFCATIYTAVANITGDAYARLGAPAGASVSADVAAVAAKTGNLPAAPAAVGDIPVASANATAVWAAGTKALTDKAGFSLAADQSSVTVGTANAIGATGLAAIWDRLTSAITTTGSIGKLVKDTLDAAVSSRLATSGYTAPANADIAAIKADLEDENAGLAHIAATTDTANDLIGMPYMGEDVSSIAGILGMPVGASLAADVAAIPSAPPAATVASAVRTELGTELGRIDAAVSSRLATSGYTAPSNTSIASILAIAQKLDTAFELDGAVYRFTTNALEEAPTDAGGGTTAQQVWEYATRTLSDKTGFALTSAYDAAKAAASAAAVSALGSPMQASTYAAPDNAGIAAVKAKTDALPSVPASKADADAATSAANAAKASADLANRTAPANSDVAAIKAKTDNLPAVPAAKGDIPAAPDLSKLDVAVSTRLAASAYSAPPSIGGLATEANATANKEAVVAAMADIEIDTSGLSVEVDLSDITDLLTPIETRLDAIGAGAVTVLSPVTADGDLTICAGDDYLAADGRDVRFSIPTANLPTLAGGSVKLKARSFTWTAARITSDHDAWLVSFDLTAEQTVHASPSGFELEATTADGHVVTLSTGTLKVKFDRPAVT